jgi:hypothetical protein
VKRLRQVSSLSLVAAFVCFNVQSVDLHIHAVTENAGDHHHGPALHHHDGRGPRAADGPRLAALDADDTVIPVRLCVTSTAPDRPTLGRCIDISLVEQPAVAIINNARVTPRAHGPPWSRPDSLRAPPRLFV